MPDLSLVPDEGPSREDLTAHPLFEGAPGLWLSRQTREELLGWVVIHQRQEVEAEQARASRHLSSVPDDPS